jgi:hypothetical protein
MLAGIVRSQQLDPIPPGALGHIESSVGPAEQGVEIALDVDVGRSADARAVEMRRYRIGKQLEYPIPKGMTEAVVGLLEMIEIEDEQRRNRDSRIGERRESRPDPAE